MIRVFSQTPPGAIDVAALVRNASRLFSVHLDVLAAEGARARLAVSRPGGTVTLQVTSRPATATDLADARAAEERGRAAGMAALAARCPSVWEVERGAVEGLHPAESAAAELELCAVLASVALGPVLPPSGETLFGVRGALERAQRARRAGG